MTAYSVPLSRIDEMADASAEAFMGNDDPIGRFLFDGEPDHFLLKKRFFRSLVTSCSPKALRQASSEKMEAVAIWFQPGLGHGEDVDADPFRPEDFSNPETLFRLAAVGGVIAELTESLGMSRNGIFIWPRCAQALRIRAIPRALSGLCWKRLARTDCRAPL